MRQIDIITSELIAYGKIKTLITTKTARIEIINLENKDLEEITKIEADIIYLQESIVKMERALNYICDEDKFIIYKKFIFNKTWTEIENSFNEKFSRSKDITYHMLKKNLYASKKTLLLILRSSGEIAKSLKNYLEKSENEIDVCVNV